MKNNERRIRKHAWLPDEEQAILAFRETPVTELKAVFFPDVSVPAIRYKKRRLLEEERFSRTGPWNEEELQFLRANLQRPNGEIQNFILRTNDQINRMRWSIKHGKSTSRIGPRRRYRFAYSTGNIQLRLAKCA
jgi:hypothetical protein